MKFDELLSLVQSEPVFTTGMLAAGDVELPEVRRQLSRWRKAGRIIQLRRGLYTLSKRYRKVDPHPFLVANAISRPSYVSCQSALSYYGLIPEAVFMYTCVTTGRPAVHQNELGRFIYRHIKVDLFWGYRWFPLDTGLSHSPRTGPDATGPRATAPSGLMWGIGAFVAKPEKALLDLIYLETGADDPGYLDALRLQNLSVLRLEELKKMARKAGKPKLRRAVSYIEKLCKTEDESYKTL